MPATTRWPARTHGAAGRRRPMSPRSGPAAAAPAAGRGSVRSGHPAVPYQSRARTTHVTPAISAAAGMVRIQAQTMRPAIPQRTADSRVVAPTPTMAPVMVWVVLTGMPATAVPISMIEPAVSAQKPPTGFSLVMPIPIILTIRQPPARVPSPIAAWAATGWSPIRQGGRLAGAAPRAPPLDSDGKHREQDHDHHHDVDVPVDVRDHLPQQIAGPGHARHPADPAEDVEEEEAPVVHLTHPGHHRGERPDDRDESREHDRLAAVALVKLARADQMLAGEPPRLLLLEDPRSGPVADGVADAVADDGGRDQERVDHPDVQTAGRRHQPGRDQERVPRQEEADQQPGLGED